MLSLVLLYFPRQTNSFQLLLPNVSLLVPLVKAKNDFREGGIPILAMAENTGLLPGLIFRASTGLLTMTGGREIGSELGGNMALHSGLMSGASYVKSSATQPFNMLNFSAMANTLVQIWR
jgi:hypothetical protein